MPFVYVESAGGGTPLIPSSRSRFFPLSESELVFVGAETATDGCDWRFKDGAVDEGLELDLGTAELGRGTAEEGWGLGVATGLGVDNTENEIWGVAETPLCAGRGWATVNELEAAAVCIATAAWACWAFARRLSSFYKIWAGGFARKRRNIPASFDPLLLEPIPRSEWWHSTRRSLLRTRQKWEKQHIRP